MDDVGFVLSTQQRWRSGRTTSLLGAVLRRRRIDDADLQRAIEHARVELGVLLPLVVIVLQPDNAAARASTHHGPLSEGGMQQPESRPVAHHGEAEVVVQHHPVKLGALVIDEVAAEVLGLILQPEFSGSQWVLLYDGPQELFDHRHGNGLVAAACFHGRLEFGAVPRFERVSQSEQEAALLLRAFVSASDLTPCVLERAQETCGLSLASGVARLPEEGHRLVSSDLRLA
mmetsp:Transcript_66552/g.192162  ORF Transcript_66552/g.192162 Transcript_66552/m.192162 type:complete len:230 (-) Transcript_66552:51-740(-)